MFTLSTGFNLEGICPLPKREPKDKTVGSLNLFLAESLSLLNSERRQVQEGWKALGCPLEQLRRGIRPPEESASTRLRKPPD